MDRGLPTGVVTFLFTDIEGSTKLLQELGPGYADALAGHRQIVRGASGRHGGVEVDTQGDAFLIAFARASDAVAAATEAQQALATGPIRVRMGLHTGEPQAGDDGYVGIDLHRGARIAAAGHGGQVLLSESTRSLTDAPIKDLGHHRLKDLSAPEHIYQLEIDGVDSDFPLLRTFESGKSNLPAQMTSFIGREEQLQAIDDRLDGETSRLITLVGPGGAGKSRLGMEAARRRVGRYPHGVFHVPLVAVSDPNLITLAIAENLGLAIDTMWGPERARDDQLIGYLAERSLMLVLDNFEHLLDGAAIVHNIGAGAPNVDVLVTSRERLALQGEWVMEVPGLEDASDRLFVERVRQGDPDFELGDTDRPHVKRICALVEHMPLGVELAAAWAAMLAPAELAMELEKSLDILTAAQRDVPERHRSLRAVFDGSWRLMSDAERTGFSRLSVFRGTFTREAARAVAEVDLPLLAALVDKSLVKRADVGRFEMHELLRQYAAEALLANTDDADGTRERHARWFMGLLKSRVDRLRGADMLDARDEIRLDIGNLRDAATWAATHWNEADAHQAFRDLDQFYMAHSWSEGAELFEQLSETRSDRRDAAWLRARSVYASRLAALNQDKLSDDVATETLGLLRELEAPDPWDTGQCLLALGTNASNRDDDEAAIRYLREARTAALESGDPHLLAWADVWLGWSEIFAKEIEATREHFDEALAAAESTGSDMLRAYATSKLGILADDEHRYDAALRYHLQAHASFERSGDRAGTGYTMTRASHSSYWIGDYEAALRYARAGLEAFSDISHHWGVTTALCRIGFALIRLGDLPQARSTLVDAVRSARDADLKALAVHAVCGIGICLAQGGDPERGATILIAAMAVDGFPAHYRDMAVPDLEAISNLLTPDQLAAAQERAATIGFDGIADEVLAEN